MDLVVGATGVVGKRIALRLHAEKRPVRAVVRGGAGRAEAQELVHAGIGIVDADLARPGSLAAACQGIENVVCTATSMPHGREEGLRRVDHDGVLALIEAAERAEVRRFVYLSYSGTLREASPLETAKRACEARLMAGSMDAVILRPTYFTEVWLSPVLGFDPMEGKARIYGTGAGKINYISAGDVAEFAVAVTLRPEPGRFGLQLGGPEALSQLDAVTIFEETVGRKFALERVPLESLEAQRQSPDPLHQAFAALMIGYAKGDPIPDALNNADLYGVRLHSVHDYASTFR